MNTIDTALPGFADPVHDAQSAFRALLEGMAHPGRIVAVPTPQALPPGLAPASASLLLTLCDADTPVWLDAAAAPIARWLAFRTGAPLATTPEPAAFALVLAPLGMPSLDAFGWGSDEVPEASTTLIVQLPALAGGRGWTLRGPGIKSTASLHTEGLPQRFVVQRRAIQAAFPRGLDIVLTCGNRLAALPRSTQLED